MYDGAPPEIPEAEAAAPPRRRERERPRERERLRDRPRDREPPREEREPAAERERHPLRGTAVLSPEAAAAVRRRRFIAAGAAAAVAVVVIAIIALSGGSDSKKPKTTPAAAQGQARIVGELLLKPVGNAAPNSQGIAIVDVRNNRPELFVQAKLPPSKQGQAYGVWLFNSPTDAVTLGAQVTDQNGNYQGRGNLPASLTRFKYIDISLQPIPGPACQRNPACLKKASAHSGKSVLRGAIADMRAPSQTGAQGGQRPPGGQPTTPGSTTGP
jgi:hypothetical protein